MLTPRVYSTPVAFDKQSWSIGFVSGYPLAPKDLKWPIRMLPRKKIFKALGWLLTPPSIAFVIVFVPQNLPSHISQYISSEILKLLKEVQGLTRQTLS